MVQRYKLNINPEDPVEVLPQVGSVGIAIVTVYGLWRPVPGQPRPNEGVTAIF